MVRGIIIDFWGVVCPDAYSAWQKTYIKNLPSHQAEFLALSQKSDRGELPLRKFYAALGKLSGQTPNKVIETLGGMVLPDEEVVATLHGLRKRGILVGLLSNSPVSLHDTVTQLELDDCFDAVLTSAEAGVTKPHPEIFGLILERLGIARDEALFLDDRTQNVEGALKYGIQSYIYSDAVKFQAQITAALDRQA